MLTSNFNLAWSPFSISTKIFLLFFSAVFVYTASVSLHALLLLRSLKDKPASGTSSDGPQRLGVLRKRAANLRQLHMFSFYLFGISASLQLPNAFLTLENSNTLPLSTIVRQLTFLFHTYAAIFLAFLVLHAFQWLVFARASSAPEDLGR